MKKKHTTQSSWLNVTRMCLALVCSAVTCTSAATIAVTNTNDNGPGSLRQAFADADNGDTISFAVTGTIGLTTGGLLVSKNIAISGPGSNQLSIDGNQALFVFGIFPGKTAAISGLTIRNAQSGAGIWNEQGTLAVSNCVLTSNSYDALYNHAGTLDVNNCMINGNVDGLYNNVGTLNMNNCVVSNNSDLGLYSYCGVTTISNCVVSGNSSGGLVNDGPHGGPPPPPPNYATGGPGSMTIADSMVSGNSGPGVSNFTGFLTVLNSTMSGNAAGGAMGGGGILSGTFFKAPAFVTIINSTISGNSAPSLGGGIYGGGWELSIANSTISGNSAPSGGGIYTYGFIDISNTILNAGASGENILNNGGTVRSHGYNISSDNGGGYLNGPGDRINTDPLLGPLQDNGGPTLTHIPLPGSPAIDAGDPNFTPPPFHDQRGPCFYRVFGHPRRIDIGSVEVQPQPRCPTPAPRPTPPPRL